MKKCVLLSGKSITLNLFFQDFINLFQEKNLKIYTSDPYNCNFKNYYCKKILLPKNYKDLLSIYFVIRSFMSLRSIVKKEAEIVNLPLSNEEKNIELIAKQQ